MTERQHPASAIHRDLEVLRHIREYIRANQYPPSIDELRAACGLESRESVARALRRLERDGHITRTPGVARGIRISGANTKARTEDLA